MRERLTLRDATGRRYEPRALALKLTDTVVRSLLLVAALYVVAALWAIFS